MLKANATSVRVGCTTVGRADPVRTMLSAQSPCSCICVTSSRRADSVRTVPIAEVASCSVSGAAWCGAKTLSAMFFAHPTSCCICCAAYCQALQHFALSTVLNTTTKVVGICIAAIDFAGSPGTVLEADTFSNCICLAT